MGMRTRLIEARDLLRLLALATLAPASFLPERTWDPVARSWVWLARVLLPARRRVLREVIRIATKDHPEMPDAERLDSSVVENRVRQELLYLRELWRPKPRRPRVRLVGRKHLVGSLERGRGAVLWVGPFLFGPLLVKKALYEAGFSIVHLSHYMHGPASSRFGHRAINGIRIRTESRYLSERIALTPGSELPVLRKLERRLRDDQIVSITWAHYGQRPVKVGVLGAMMEVGTGAPALALSTGAPLLPVFTVREAAAVYEVVIEPPLEPPEASGRREAIGELLRRYVGRMESHVVRCPESFYGWSHMSAGGNRHR
jgi:lauroyl/myristoyl acyltransferase